MVDPLRQNIYSLLNELVLMITVKVTTRTIQYWDCGFRYQSRFRVVSTNKSRTSLFELILEVYFHDGN